MNRLGLRRRSWRGAFLIASASILSLAAASPALAQDEDQNQQNQNQNQAQNNPDEGEIIITAQFREQRLQDTPLSITAIDAEMLEQRSQRSLAEVTAQAPNVQLRQAGASFGDSLTAFIRGVGQADFDPALEPGVGLYLDDVYYSSLTGANFELLDLERVEVLRGPQGTLEGRNSEGGAVRLISRRPDADGGGFVEATYGDRNLIAFRGGATFTVADGVYARISGTTRQQRGYVDRIDYGCSHPGSGVTALRAAGDCNYDPEGGVGHTAIRGQLRFHPNPDFDLMLSADYTHINQTNTAGVLTYANLDNVNTNPAPGVPYDARFICGQYCNYAQFSQPVGTFQVSPFGQIALGLNPTYPEAATQGQDRQVFDGWNLAANLDWHLNEALTLQSITAYREWKLTFNADDDLSPANINMGQDRLDFWFFSHEMRLNANLAPNLQATVGAYYSAQRTTYFTVQDIRYIAADIPGFGYSPFYPLQFIGDDPVRAHNYAFFGTVIWHPIPNLTFTGGLRYTNEHKDYTYVRLNLDGTAYSGPNGGFAGLNGTRADYDGDRLDYRASIDYRFSPEVLVYATLSTGFKGGGTNPRPFNAAQARPFNPETLTNYEIGFKTDLFNRMLRFNVSAFYDRFNRDPNSGPLLPAIRRSGTLRAARECRQRRHLWDRGGSVPAAGSRSADRCLGELSAHPYSLHPDHDGPRAEPGRGQFVLLRSGDCRHSGFAAARHSGVEVELRHSVRVPGDRRDADAALRHVPSEPYQCGERRQRSAGRDPRLHGRQCAADMAERRQQLAGLAGGHQPVRRILLSQQVRPARRGRRLHQRPARPSARMGGHADPPLLGVRSVTCPGAWSFGSGPFL